MLYAEVCYGVCFLLSGSQVAFMLPHGGQLLGFAMPQPNGVYPWQAYMPPGDGLWLTPGVH